MNLFLILRVIIYTCTYVHRKYFKVLYYKQSDGRNHSQNENESLNYFSTQHASVYP